MTNKLTKILAVPILAGAALLSGCQSDTGFALDLIKIKLGNQTAAFVPKEQYAETSREVFNKDCQPYDKSEISNGANIQANTSSTAPIWNHYKNRNIDPNN